MVSEAASVAKAIGGRAPVKLVWTREDDIRGGRYRPMYFHRLRAGLDADGRLIGWQHRIVGQSIARGTPFAAGMIENGIDHTSVEGATTLPYHVPNIAVALHPTDLGVPVLWWRAVGGPHPAHPPQAFHQQLPAAAGTAPVAVRR